MRRTLPIRRRTLLAGLPVFVVMAACGKVLPPPGELVVAVTTDLSIPKDIDTIRIQVVPPNGNTPYDYAFSVYPGEFSGQPTGVKIPATLGVLAGSGPVETVLVRVMAISTPKNETLILREASVQVPTNRTALLQLPLQWLSEGSAKDSTTSTLALPDSDKIVEARCKQGDTEIAGVCTSDFVDVDTLPDYEPGLVFGGGGADGGGTCFDTVGCFATASPATLDMTACAVGVPAGADTTHINLALVPLDGAGICAPGSTKECFVPLDENSPYQNPPEGWTYTKKKGLIQLPPGVCDAIQNGLAARVVVSTTCATKTPANPTCGPWDADQRGDAGAVPEDGATTDAEGSDAVTDRDSGEEASAGDTGGGRDATTTAEAGKDGTVEGSHDSGRTADVGVDSESSPADSALRLDEGALCTPGATQCSLGTSVQTCDSTGNWGSIWPCATGTCQKGTCAGTTTTGTSCQTGDAGVTTCGPGGVGTESCCTSLEVPGGAYYRTYTSDDGGTAAGEADPATVSGFRLDKYLVTVGRFRQFVNDVLLADGGIGWYPTEGSGKHSHLNDGLGLLNSASELPDAGPVTYETGWDAVDWNNTTDIDPTDANLTCYSPQDTWTQNGTNHENLPINCVTWYEAYAFCIWDGGFLPAEAEWEYAAAGGSEQREYPWGSAGPGTANQYAIYGYNYGTLGAYMAPVGYASLGAGRWGQLDLVGEVLEWNVDSYATTYVDPCTDCAYLTAPSSQVARGGLYIGSAVFLSPSFTYFGPSPTLRDFIGFRCARTP